MTSSVLALGLAAPPPGSRDARRSLHAQLREAILTGRLAAGLRLPASRTLARALGVSRNTVVAIYDLLLAEGYVVSRTGAGTFVAALTARTTRAHGAREDLDPQRLAPAWRTPLPERNPPISPPRFDLRLGSPDAKRFPFDIWGRLNARALRTLARAPATTPEPGGRLALRQAIASHVSATRAVACGPDDVVVTTGAQQAFDLLARVLLRPGDTVAFEDPGYPRARQTFIQAGARMAFVPVDTTGLEVARIPDVARVICVTPSHQFPLGVAMSPERRQALLAHAARTDALVIEDDYDSEFRFAGRPLDALKTLDREGRVFYVGTFSKSMFPAVRLGFIVAPAWARPALVSARQIADGHGAVVVQDALAAFVAEGHLARHVRAMQRIYAQRRAAMLDALRAHCAERLELLPSIAGLHLAARIRRPGNLGEIAERAARQGLLIDRLVLQSPDALPADVIPLSYGRIEAEAIDAAMRSLAAALT